MDTGTIKSKLKNGILLKTKVYQGAKLRYGSLTKQIEQRIEQELTAIIESGQEEYFLAIAKMICLLSNKDVAIGPGRGSAASSVVSYCLGLTEVDPIKFNLKFERFFNIAVSTESPDISFDIDIPSEEAHAIINDMIGTSENIPLMPKFTQLSVLRQIKQVEDGIKNSELPYFRITDIPLDDEKSLNVFREGRTQGVFLFESEGMNHILLDFSPENFSDLILLNAMFYPGAMDKLPEILARKNGKIWDKSAIPEVNEILEESYGMIVYQEQIMDIVNVVADIPMTDADILRKLICRKEDTSAYKERFLKGGKTNGHQEMELLKLWDHLTNVGFMPFLKAHSVCSTLTAYRKAYIKANFPGFFKKTN